MLFRSFLFVYWEKLTVDFSQVVQWVDTLDAEMMNGVFPGGDGEDLQKLVNLVNETLFHAKEMKRDNTHRDAGSYPSPLVTARYYAFGVDALGIRTVFYLAQVSVHSYRSSVIRLYSQLRIPRLIQHHITEAQTVEARILAVLTCAFTVWDDHSLSPLLADLTKPR